MRNRYTQRPDHWDYTGNQLARKCFEGACSWCPAHNNENSSGSHSQWGRKVATKTFYATGKGRKEKKAFYRRGRKLWFYDKHDEIEKPKSRRKEKMELSRGHARYMLDEYIKYLKRNRNSIADYAAGYLNRDSWGGCTASCGGLSFGYDGRTDDFTLFVSFRRKKPYYRYLPPEE